jgi:hypothetical protein
VEIQDEPYHAGCVGVKRTAFFVNCFLPPIAGSGFCVRKHMGFSEPLRFRNDLVAALSFCFDSVVKPPEGGLSFHDKFDFQTVPAPCVRRLFRSSRFRAERFHNRQYSRQPKRLCRFRFNSSRGPAPASSMPLYRCLRFIRRTRDGQRRVSFASEFQ